MQAIGWRCITCRACTGCGLIAQKYAESRAQKRQKMDDSLVISIAFAAFITNMRLCLNGLYYLPLERLSPNIKPAAMIWQSTRAMETLGEAVSQIFYGKELGGPKKAFIFPIIIR